MAVCRIAVAGCTGELGRRVIRVIAAHERCRLTGALASPTSTRAGQDAGEVAGAGHLEVPVALCAERAFAHADVAIDFSVAAAAPTHAAAASAAGLGLVLATTGLDEGQLRAVRLAAEQAPVLLAPNLSPALNVMLLLVEQAASILDDCYDAEVLGLAHRRKRDAPSGGAMEIGAAIARGRGVALEQSSIRTRDGDIGARPRGAIGFASIRGGEGAGEHAALFAGDRERLELTHRVGSRSLYAHTAVDAALWLRDRAPGVVSMRDFLGF